MTTTGRVAGKVALISGGASGLGRASGVTLARQGAKVVLTDLNTEAGEAAAAEIGPEAFFLAHDVTKEDDWSRVMGIVEDRFGRLDVLVNSAGIGILRNVEETTLEDWRRVMAVNLDGVFLGCKHAIGLMKRADGGSIINLSSVSGLVGGHNLAAYNASKGGVRLLTKSVALHCAQQGNGIRCNSVHPTFIDTPMVQSMIDGSGTPERTKAALERQIPLGRLGRAEEVADMILYLASDESRFVTGSEMIIDGGATAQ